MSWDTFCAISTAARQAMYLDLLANCEPSGYTMVGIFLRPAETYKVKKV